MPPDYTAAHQLVEDMSSSGGVADFSDEGDPVDLPDYDDEDFWAERSIDGAWLADFIAASGERLHRRGVRVIGARIANGLDLEAVRLDRPLGLASCEIGVAKFNFRDAEVVRVSLVGSRCGGVDAAWIRDKGGFDLRRVEAIGEVRLSGATIGGSFSCAGGQFVHSGGYAIALDGADIRGSAYLTDGFRATGEVNLNGATIRGNFECSGGEFCNPDGIAITADNARITGSAFLDDGFEATGQVRLNGATIGTALTCQGGRFTSTGEYALNLEGADITGGLFLNAGFKAVGVVSLFNTTAHTLVDDRDSWPETLTLVGFRYQTLHSPERSWQHRRVWLRRQRQPNPQAYVHLASVYRAAGDDLDARKILIERHNVLLDPPHVWTQQLPTRLRRLPSWVARSFLRLTIGHGYEPWRALAIAVPLVAAMSFWYATAAHQNLLVPTGSTSATASSCTSGYTCVQPAVYAIDTILPLVDLGQRDKWAPDRSHNDAVWYRDGRWLAAATWLTTVLGWALATLVAAGFTQVVRRE